MTVNGLKLPDALVALIDRPNPVIYFWKPKEGVERYPLVDDDEPPDWLELCKDLTTIETRTSRLPISMGLGGVTDEDIEEWTAESAHLPGFIPFLTDFSKIVCFGNTGSGEPYCFDYRDSPDRPSIIEWNDAYWRRVAWDFDSFIDLYEPA